MHLQHRIGSVFKLLKHKFYDSFTGFGFSTPEQIPTFEILLNFNSLPVSPELSTVIT